MNRIFFLFFAIVFIFSVVVSSGISGNLEANDRECMKRCIETRCPNKKYKQECEKQNKKGCKRDCRAR